MNVTAQYPVTVHSPTQIKARGPRDLEDVPFRGSKQARFDNHDDFYSFLDSNRGPGGNGPVAPGGGPGGMTATQIQIPPQSQRGVQTLDSPTSPGGPDQSRPPVTNSFVPQRTSSGRSRPPSYSGSRSEELLVDRRGENGVNGGGPQKNGDAGTPHKVQRQNGRRGGGARPGTAGGGPPPNSGTNNKNMSSPRTNGTSSPSSHPRRNSVEVNGNGVNGRPASSDSLNNAAGAAIERLKSPSVMSCVLQPLDQKVKEYTGLMHAEQDEMTRLDDEIRALQERRSRAEMRYLDAKSKHDDYLRQYQDVERAMRGEAPLSRDSNVPRTLPQPSSHQQQQRAASLRDDEEEFDEEEEYVPEPVHRQMNSQQSFGRSSQKGGFGARFRNSIFGSR